MSQLLESDERITMNIVFLKQHIRKWVSFKLTNPSVIRVSCLATLQMLFCDWLRNRCYNNLESLLQLKPNPTNKYFLSFNVKKWGAPILFRMNKQTSIRNRVLYRLKEEFYRRISVVISFKANWLVSWSFIRTSTQFLWQWNLYWLMVGAQSSPVAV